MAQIEERILGWGGGLLAAAFAASLCFAAGALATAAAAPPQVPTYRYVVVHTQKEKTFASELNEAGAEGCRVVVGSAGDYSLMAILECPSNRP